MRSHQNASGSSSRRVGGALRLSPLRAPLPPPRLPMEWLDAVSWRMPSGKALAEFALQAGFLAPLLLKAEQLGESGTSLEPGSAERSKQFAKGSSR